MKLFTLLLLTSLSAQAVTLIKYRSAPETESIQQFEINSRFINFRKESNFFDPKEEYEVGVYEIKSSPALEAHARKLDDLEKKLEAADKFLTETKNISLNEITKHSPHDSIFILGKYKINPGSKHFPVLQEIFRDLQSQDKKMISGVKVNSDLLTYVSVENRKVSQPQKFSLEERCLKNSLPTICKFKDAGVLYIEKPKATR